MSDPRDTQSAREARAAELLLGGALRPSVPPGPCPSAEELAAFIDGRSPASERDAIVAHIERCEACRAVAGGVADLVTEFDHVVLPPLPGAGTIQAGGNWFSRHRAASMSALGVAAALVVAVWVGVRFMAPERRLERALARMDAAAGDVRPVQARLTGASYRPAPPVTRAAAADAEAPLDVRDAANAVERAVAGVPEGVAARALAQVHLTKGRPDRAVDALARFVTGSRDARLLSDASAAYLARARDGDQAQALDAAARAVEIDRNLAAAWFNYGLAADALGQHPLAAEAWDQVIKLEPGSDWAREAAERKAQAPKRQSWKPQDETEFRAAIAAGDDDAAMRIAERSLTDARAFFERSILGEIGQVWTSSDRRALQASAARAEVAGRALGRLSSDRWPLDVASQLRSALKRSPTAGAACVPAWLEAVRLRSRDRLTNAADAVSQAPPCATSISEALAMHTAFIPLRVAANANPPAPDLSGKLAELARVAGARDYYGLQGRALRAQGWLLGNRGEHVAAIDRYRAAEAAFIRSQESDQETAIAALIAEQYDLVGARDLAWRERQRALRRLYTVASPVGRYNIYKDAIMAAVDRSLYGAALGFLDTALADLPDFVEARLLLLSDRAALLARLGRQHDAATDVHTAVGLLAKAGMVASPEAYRRIVLKAQAIVALSDDWPEAVRKLTDVIQSSSPQSTAFDLAELYFFRATAYVRGADPHRAGADFRSGFDLVEQRQALLPDDLRPAAFDRTWDAMSAAIRFEAVTRNEPWNALALAERARAASLTSRVSGSKSFEGADAFRRALPPDTGVVFVSALDDDVLSWGMARDVEPTFNRSPIKYGELATLAETFRSALRLESSASIEALGRQLYQIVLSRHTGMLSRTSILVIIPDGPLLAVPFAATVTPNGHFLVEDRAVVVAPSLRLLGTLSTRHRDRTGARTAIAIGNPAHAPNLPWRLSTLAGAQKEAEMVAATYAGTPLLGANATTTAFLEGLRTHDVVHFAGHAVVNSGPIGVSSLVLAPALAEDAGLLSSRDLDRISLPPGALIVLAACDSADGTIFRGEGLMGLVRPFIAGGASTVLANLWPVEDQPAVDFADGFHRHVQSGLAPAQALRRIQTDFVARKRPPQSWAGWVMVGGLH